MTIVNQTYIHVGINLHTHLTDTITCHLIPANTLISTSMSLQQLFGRVKKPAGALHWSTVKTSLNRSRTGTLMASEPFLCMATWFHRHCSFEFDVQGLIFLLWLVSWTYFSTSGGTKRVCTSGRAVTGGFLSGSRRVSRWFARLDNSFIEQERQSRDSTVRLFVFYQQCLISLVQTFLTPFPNTTSGMCVAF